MAALWIVCFIVIVTGAQFVRWSLQVFTEVGMNLDLSGLPLPILVLAGTALAIAANSRKQWGLPLDAIAPARSEARSTPPPPAEPAAPAVPASSQQRPAPAISVKLTPPRSTPTPTKSPANSAAQVSYHIDPNRHHDERRPS